MYLQSLVWFQLGCLVLWLGLVAKLEMANLQKDMGPIRFRFDSDFWVIFIKTNQII